jgi:hypothetical protein
MEFATPQPMKILHVGKPMGDNPKTIRLSQTTFPKPEIHSVPSMSGDVERVRIKMMAHGQAQGHYEIWIPHNLMRNLCLWYLATESGMNPEQALTYAGLPTEYSQNPSPATALTPDRHMKEIVFLLSEHYGLPRLKEHFEEALNPKPLEALI